MKLKNIIYTYKTVLSTLIIQILQAEIVQTINEYLHIELQLLYYNSVLSLVWRLGKSHHRISNYKFCILRKLNALGLLSL